jgi:hypothetical protein
MKSGSKTIFVGGVQPLLTEFHTRSPGFSDHNRTL